ncbi:MAG: xanthine dehydrogenase family protein subunit M [Kiloniellales bacterium]
MGTYHRPKDIGSALRVLGAGAPTIVAGGTDFYPARVGRFIDENVLDITAVDGLGGIDESDGHFRIGATTTWAQVIEADLPPWFDGLKQAARELGGVQTQNAGTVCGNICNASPAADGVPPLLTMDAAVEVASLGGQSSLPLSEFILGNRRTALEPGQMVTGLSLPKPAHPARGAFLKLGARKYLVISIAMVAAVIERDGAGCVAGARIAVGACSEVARRLPDLEAALMGRPLSADLGAAVQARHLDPLLPIDDVRGSAEYRRDAALIALRRCLAELAGGP